MNNASSGSNDPLLTDATACSVKVSHSFEKSTLIYIEYFTQC
jgi:hypothetical protein